MLRLFKYTPFRILLPIVLMTLLVAAFIFLYLLPSMEQTFLKHKKEDMVALTNAVISSLNHFHERARSGDFTREEAQQRGSELVRDMRYGPENKDYFWINDTTSRMVMHPYRPDLEGKDLTAFTDKHGKAPFVEFVRTARQSGGGFVGYHWQWKDKPGEEYPKLSYVREFEPWSWVVGTGMYMDDIEAEMADYRNRILAIMLAILFVIACCQAYVLRKAALAEERKAKAMAQREKLLHALKEGEERYRTIADFAYDWEVWFSPEGDVLYSSPSCERLTGYPPESFIESPAMLRSIIIDDDKEAWDTYVQSVPGQDGNSFDFRIYAKEGYAHWLNVTSRPVYGIGQKPLGIRSSFRDVTDRKQMEEQLRHQALHDPLTGLANRTLCLDRISQSMRRAARRENYYFAVVFLDLDRFKVINDSLGHRFGDMVLKETARRLKDHVRTLDTVSRFGGDEFVLLLDELASPGECVRIIKRIRHAMADPFVFNEAEVQTTASFGIVLSPIGDIEAADVLQHSNIAMHRAKEAGRNRFKVFTGRMLETAVDQLSLENDMRRGIERGEFHIKYQPIMDLEGSDLMGFEALARWNHPERGPIPPTEFIPRAEESGIILQLGEWVLHEALQTLSRWRAEFPGSDDIFMSVNLSSKQFARLELDKIVLKALDDAGLQPNVLKLEITESAIMDNPESAVRVLNLLRNKGVRFSIDDFGTGYSSLTQLQKLPVDTLKVDRSFISRMETDPENMEIVKAVIALAHSLDLEVVAEGVEVPKQVCSLLDLDCEGVQGFYFHKPLHPDEAGDLLRRRSGDDSGAPREALARVKAGCE